jgi:perosamine synthetase
MSSEPRVPLAFPLTGEEELAAVGEVLRSGWLTQGPKVVEFERLVAECAGTRHAVAASSCTTALHLSVAALGLGPGDEVLVPDFTFPATANVVLQQGARPVLVDVDLETYNVDPDALARHLTARTRAVLPVHLFGLAADMDPVVRFARDHGLAVIEDAACALGATYSGRPCGSMGDLGCFSFHPRKVITTGEGGMVVTNRDDLAERLRLLRSHGGLRHGGRFTFEDAGYNYRLSDIHAAVGAVQMGHLDELVARRRELAAALREGLHAIEGIEPPGVPAWDGHVYQSFVAMVDEDVDRDRLVVALRDRGVETTIGTYALHRQPAFAPYARSALPRSSSAFARTLALPLYPSMGDKEIEMVLDALRAALPGARSRPRAPRGRVAS